MTLLAVHFFMAPAQRKAAVFFVVEFLGKPIDRHVANSAVGGRAVSSLATGELAAVDISVAIGAMTRRAFEGQLYLSLDPILLVARRAGDQGMTINQTKVGRRVIKNRIPPGVLTVAGHTARLVRMRAAMAIRTSSGRRSQIGRLGVDTLAGSTGSPRHVAAETGCGQMGTAQGERGLGMARQSVRCRFEALDSVAFLASHQPGPLEPDAVVGIAVAIAALGKSRLLAAVAVALGAADTGVASQERIARATVVKGLAVDLQPTRGGVALSAVGAKSRGVRILMTGSAILMGLGFENGHGHYAVTDRDWLSRLAMAFGTIDLLVLAGQRKSSQVVIKTSGRTPGFGTVAGGAGSLLLATGQDSGVRILVTGQTILAQAQPGSLQVLVQRTQSSRIRHMLRVVALAAFEFQMGTGHCVTQHRVVEILLTVGPEQ